MTGLCVLILLGVDGHGSRGKIFLLLRHGIPLVFFPIVLYAPQLAN